MGGERGDPHFLQETREQWNAAKPVSKPSLSPAETSASTSGSSSSATTTSTTSTATSNTSSTATSSKKKKKKRKQRAKQVVITIQENGDDDDDDDEIDPRQLGWDECARRGRLDATATNSGIRGRPNTRPKQL